MIEIVNEKYLNIAFTSGVFKPQEIDILEEVILEWQKNPNESYFLFDEKYQENIVGFIIFGKTPLTDFSWDIYWLAVDKNFQGKGYGRKLLKKTENFLLQQLNQVTIRVETSSRKEYTNARNLYLRNGFKETGRIPDFYSHGDDLVIFYKQLDNFKI